MTGYPSGFIQPHDLLCKTPKTSSAMPRADNIELGRSIDILVVGFWPLILLDSNNTPVITTASAANTYRHDRLVVTKPPMTGPTAADNPVTAPMTENATTRLLPV